MHQIPILFPGDHFVMIPVNALITEIRKRKKIYTKHKINMKSFNYLNLVAAYEKISAHKPVMQNVKVIEHPYLEPESIVFDRDNMVILTGCLYKFLFWFGSVKGTPMMETVDQCIEQAKSKISRCIEAR